MSDTSYTTLEIAFSCFYGCIYTYMYMYRYTLIALNLAILFLFFFLSRNKNEQVHHKKINYKTEDGTNKTKI